MEMETKIKEEEICCKEKSKNGLKFVDELESHSDVGEKLFIKEEVNQNDIKEIFVVETISNVKEENTEDKISVKPKTELKFTDKLKCQDCGKVFKRKESLKLHLKIHLTPDERKKLLYECPDCDKKYTSKHDLKLHRKGIHLFEESKVIKSEISNEELKLKKRLECETCKKVFSRYRNLKLHLETHLTPDEREKLLFACPECDKKYTRRHDLKTHRETIHSFEESANIKMEKESKNLNPLECEVCKKVLKTKRILKVHLKTHLTSEEKQKLLLFACPQCDKKFFRMYEVKVHIKSFHLKEKPFVCEMCGKTFALSKQLFQHNRVVHDNNQQRCPLCPKSFKNFCKLKSHIQNTHNVENYECLECGQILKNKKTLDSHMLTHNDLKPFICDICGKSFKWDKNLKSHRITHTGTKPFDCRFCTQSYANKSNCIKHEKHSHSEEYIKSSIEEKK